MDELYKEIVQFQHRVNDWLDDPAHQSAQNLKREVQKLEDDAQSRKNAYSLEDQTKRVIQSLEHVGNEQAMSHGHVDELVNQCEDIIEKLRKLR